MPSSFVCVNCAQWNPASNITCSFCETPRPGGLSPAEDRKNQMYPVLDGGGPLPMGWEMVYHAGGKRYFYVDHHLGKTQWVDPRQQSPQSQSLSSTSATNRETARREAEVAQRKQALQLKLQALQTRAEAQRQNEQGRWECISCTFLNEGSKQRCQICNEPKPAVAARKSTAKQPRQSRAQARKSKPARVEVASPAEDMDRSLQADLGRLGLSPDDRPAELADRALQSEMASLGLSPDDRPAELADRQLQQEMADLGLQNVSSPLAANGFQSYQGFSPLDSPRPPAKSQPRPRPPRARGAGSDDDEDDEDDDKDDDDDNELDDKDDEDDGDKDDLRLSMGGGRYGVWSGVGFSLADLDREEGQTPAQFKAAQLAARRQAAAAGEEADDDDDVKVTLRAGYPWRTPLVLVNLGDDDD